MKIIKLFGLVSLITISFLYYIGAFASASFNLSEWEPATRGFVAFFYGFSFYHDNSRNDINET